MDVEYGNPKLKTLCEDRRTATRQLGNSSARRLGTRLSELFAASCVGDLVAGNPHPLKGDRSDEFSVKLSGGDRLVFECNNDPVPLIESDSVDWPCVTSVLITYVGDYHD